MENNEIQENLPKDDKKISFEYDNNPKAQKNAPKEEKKSKSYHGNHPESDINNTNNPVSKTISFTNYRMIVVSFFFSLLLFCFCFMLYSDFQVKLKEKEDEIFKEIKICEIYYKLNRCFDPVPLTEVKCQE